MNLFKKDNTVTTDPPKDESFEDEVPLPQLPRVEIVWVDALHDEAHLDLEEMANFNVAHRQSIGYIVRSDEEKLVLTHGLSDNDIDGKVFIEGIFVIPWRMIEEIIDLDED